MSKLIEFMLTWGAQEMGGPVPIKKLPWLICFNSSRDLEHTITVLYFIVDSFVKFVYVLEWLLLTIARL